MDYLAAIWMTMCLLAPWMLVGTAIAGLIHVLLPAGFLERAMRGRSGVVKAVLIGVPLPLCSCGVIPAGIGLRKNGASRGSTVGFLISTPQTGVDSILVAASFLGWPFALFKIGAAAITGVIGGWMTDIIEPEKHEEIQQPDRATTRRGVRDFYEHGKEILQSIWLWLIAGVFVSAAITQFVPPSTFEVINEYGLLLSLCLVLLISTPLYVCATASVPIAWALVSSGMPVSVALVFLMAGPATNIATISALLGKFGWRTTGVYLLTIVIGSMAFAFLFEWIIPSNIANLSHGHDHLAHEVRWWEQVSAVLLSLIFVGFAAEALWAKFFKNVPEFAQDEGKQLTVDGMHCENCANAIQRAIGQLENVESVHVDLKNDLVQVMGDCDLKEIKETIGNAGYEVREPLDHS